MKVTESEPGTVQYRAGSPARKRAGSLDWIVVSSLAVAFVTAAFWLVQMPPAVSFWWDSLMAMGLVCAQMTVLLGVLSPRFWSLNGHDATALLHLHRYLGMAVLGLGLVHGIGLLLVEPVTLEYLKLRAPNYMLAGIGALLAMAALVWPSLKRMAWRMHYRLWHISHALLALLALGLMLWHLLGSGYGFSEDWKKMLLAMALLLPTCWIYLLGRRRPAVPWRPFSHSTHKGRAALAAGRRYAVTWCLAAGAYSLLAGLVRQL